MHAIRFTASVATLAVLTVAGCGSSNSTTATDANSGTGATGVGHNDQVTGPQTAYGLTASSQIGEAPSLGAAAGNGFHTGDADQSGGMGSGMEGYHGVGAAGTSGTITDMSKPADVQELGMSKSAAK